MTFTELQKLVREGEGWKLEFKRKVQDPLKIVREMVAFANNKGGQLLIGVNDDGHISGLKYPEEELFVLEKALQEHCPSIRYEAKYIPISSKKHVLLFDIHESNQKPLFLIYNTKKGTGRAYYRVEDKSIHASREVRKILQARQAENPTTLVYGDNEQQLMQLFSEQAYIDIDLFAESANISREEASQTLIKLTVSNVLEVLPGDKKDIYLFKDSREITD